MIEFAVQEGNVLDVPSDLLLLKHHNTSMVPTKPSQRVWSQPACVLTQRFDLFPATSL